MLILRYSGRITIVNIQTRSGSAHAIINFQHISGRNPVAVERLNCGESSSPSNFTQPIPTKLEIGRLEKLKDFDLTNAVVAKKMKERYGKNIPKDETVISPAAIFQSDLLYTVRAN